MKLINTTLSYITRTTEDVGMWTEKIICDILKIKFNTKRSYITTNNYPIKLKKDIFSIKHILLPLNISEHLGNKNEYYDFKTINGETVSLKTNINGSKICPQFLGQTTLQRFNEKTGYKLQNQLEYKSLVLNDTTKIVNLYLSYLFCCEHLLSFKFDQGKIYYFKKTANVSFSKNHTIIFKASKELSNWNNSMSLSIIINEKLYQLCEFQIHQSRNCIQCRFNLDTIVLLVLKRIIENVNVKSFDLQYKYNIKVLKSKFDDIETEIKTKKRKVA